MSLLSLGDALLDSVTVHFAIWETARNEFSVSVPKSSWCRLNFGSDIFRSLPEAMSKSPAGVP